MRIVSYNILNGGVGRADPLAEVILAARPDVVAIVEADDIAVLDRIAYRLKMDYIQAAGKKHASALFSRWPIRSSINHALVNEHFTKSMLEAEVTLPDGAAYTFGVPHLHSHATDGDETIREKEVAALLEIFAARRAANQPHVLCGDFNSNSPSQKIDPARCKPSAQREWAENGNRFPRRVVQMILDAGYIDTLAAAEPDRAASQGSFTTQHPGQRVDYIFAFGAAKESISAAWIEQDRLATYASDHYPVGAEIQIG
jgi:endonuclease/exonuclease/phosphatase family metal-dependent hydrolase